MSTETLNEIRPVSRVVIDGGEAYVTCPHCGETLGLPSGPIRGETFQHRVLSAYSEKVRGCQGWFEVTSNARKEYA